MSHLIGVMVGPDRGTIWTMTGEPMIFGRGEDAASHLLHDPTVSRRHCRIKSAGDYYTIEDLRSGNGTHVNGELLHQRTRLHHGDIIVVGSSILRYHQLGRGAVANRQGSSASTIISVADIHAMQIAALRASGSKAADMNGEVSGAIQRARTAVLHRQPDVPYCDVLIQELLSSMSGVARICMIFGRPDGSDAPLSLVTRDREGDDPGYTPNDLVLGNLVNPAREVVSAATDDDEACVIARDARTRRHVSWFVQIPVIWSDRVVCVVYCEGSGPCAVSNREIMTVIGILISHAPGITVYGCQTT